jgi:DNA repair protein RadC
MGDLSDAQVLVASGPRERILQFGEQRLSDAECLALVLRTGVRGEPAEQMAHRLLRSYGGLSGLSVRSVRELAREGVGPVRAAALLGAFGLARRLSEEGFRPGTLVRHGGDVAQVVRHTARGSRRENFFVVLLDVRSRVMGLQQVSTGVVDSAPVHPREVFGPAVRESAVAVVIAHNHPSGDPSPSKQDHDVTQRLKAAGTLLGIDVLDHVVVGTDRYYSFADEAFFAYS